MKETQNTEQISTEDMKEWLLNIHEKYFVELKKANELPNSFGKATHPLAIHLVDLLFWEC